MQDFVIGNMVWNGTLIVALAFFIKKWISSMENKITSYCQQNRDEHDKLFNKADTHEHRITVLEVKSEG